ncbi:hypothetical protein V6N13_135809 [Hibiscus sabdariffa]
MESPIDVWNRAFGAFEECSSILNPILPHQLTESPIFQTPPVALSWTAPPLGFLKINCDAALDRHNGTAAVACVVQDESGRIIKGETCSFPSWSISVAEAIAVRKGVLLAIDEAWEKPIIDIRAFRRLQPALRPPLTENQRGNHGTLPSQRKNG